MFFITALMQMKVRGVAGIRLVLCFFRVVQCVYLFILSVYPRRMFFLRYKSNN